MRECNGIKFFLTYPPNLSRHPGCRQGFGIPWYPARILPAVSHGLHERYTVMRVALQTSSVAAMNGLHTYIYDHRTRRTRNFTPTTADQVRVSFSGEQSVQEYFQYTGTVALRETIRGSDMGGGVGGVLYTNEGATSPVFNHYNSRGDVVSQTNSGGGVEWEAKYEAFGTRTDEAGAATGHRPPACQYQGRGPACSTKACATATSKRASSSPAIPRASWTDRMSTPTSGRTRGRCSILRGLPRGHHSAAFLGLNRPTLGFTERK